MYFVYTDRNAKMYHNSKIHITKTFWSSRSYGHFKAVCGNYVSLTRVDDKWTEKHPITQPLFFTHAFDADWYTVCAIVFHDLPRSIAKKHGFCKVCLRKLQEFGPSEIKAELPVIEVVNFSPLTQKVILHEEPL